MNQLTGAGTSIGQSALLLRRNATPSSVLLGLEPFSNVPAQSYVNPSAAQPTRTQSTTSENNMDLPTRVVTYSPHNSQTDSAPLPQHHRTTSEN